MVDRAKPSDKITGTTLDFMWLDEFSDPDVAWNPNGPPADKPRDKPRTQGSMSW